MLAILWISFIFVTFCGATVFVHSSLFLSCLKLFMDSCSVTEHVLGKVSYMSNYCGVSGASEQQHKKDLKTI